VINSVMKGWLNCHIKKITPYVGDQNLKSSLVLRLLEYSIQLMN